MDCDHIEEQFDELWPITRSITGPGFRNSLAVLQEDIPLEAEAVPSGTEVFDWEVPPEWRIHNAKLTGPEGTVYADIDETNLAVVNYSASVDAHLTRDELEPHLYTEPNLPDATPYVTSYYNRTWGFCLPHTVYEDLPDGEYHAYIDSEFDQDGVLNYGHTVLKGETDKEVLLSTYLCHPSMANNELSGPLVLSSLYRQLEQWDHRKYTYRFVVVPETIGSLSYLSQHGDHLVNNVIAGLVLTCLGGPNETLSYQRTRQGDTLIDSLIEHLDNYSEYDFEIRPFTPTGGSDERQYCSPGFDLPVGQMARTVYGDYDAYHTSHDTKAFMSIDAIIDSAARIEYVLRLLEYSGRYENVKPYGEPFLSKYDLYTSINSPETRSDSTDDIKNDQEEFLDNVLMLLNYSDGTNSVVSIANQQGRCVDEFVPAIRRLQREGLLQAR
jgi:aminopeptidase-like protein